MTEDMRCHPALKALRQWEEDCLGPATASEGNAFIEGFHAGQAALSSAGTSGTPDRCPLCESQVREIRLCLICDTSHKTELYSNRQCIAAGKPNFCSDPWHRGDSLSGKGEATSVEVCAEQPGHFKTVASKGYASAPDRAEVMGKDGKPDHFRDAEEMVAPDRAEELAAKIFDLLLCEWDYSEVKDLRQAQIDRVASLLREAEGRCPTCGLTIVPRLCANPACASSAAVEKLRQERDAWEQKYEILASKKGGRGRTFAELREARERAERENERLIDAWMCDETIGESGKKTRDGRIIPDGSLRPHIRKTIERAERAEKALRVGIEKLELAMRTSGNRWEEWGERALSVAELLDEALASLKSSEGAK